MNSYLYRFRSIEALLGKHDELRKQEIYFASPSELNDPMEGFSDVFWQGDKIVWENLLRHFLVCLERSFALAMIGGESHRTTWEQIPVIDPGDLRAFTPEHHVMHEMIFEKFFGEPAVVQFIDSLAGREGPIRRRELAMHLTCAHQFTMLTIHEVYQERKLTPVLNPDNAQRSSALKMLQHSVNVITQLKVLKTAQPVGEDDIESLFSVTGLMSHQMSLIHFHNQQADLSKPAINFLAHGFAEGYVKEIERILYPEWYVACFMENCSSSSIWGTYGSEHKGICLRFKTTQQAGRHTLVLNRISGADMNGPVRSDVSQPFNKIAYTRELGTIDFFSSIGRLPEPILNKYWYTNAKGERSTSAAAMDSSIENWRESYWRNFNIRSTRKLEDWKLEAEHRIVMYSSINDLSTPNARKAVYRFEDLDGIIFGIRTSLEDKLKICRVIEEKCKEKNRKNFKFFQASFSRTKGVIEHHELSLLKFQL
jgi:hypothetical protein